MIKKEIKTIVHEYDSIEELSKTEQQLVSKAKEVLKTAYSPYSHFSVGAAILLENGEIICGTNQENAAYPSGLCAERVAMFYANSNYPDVKPITIAVAAYSEGDYVASPIPPCGSCRQALLESESRFKSPIKIILAGQKKIYILENIKTLLPLSFEGKFLEKKK